MDRSVTLSAKGVLLAAVVALGLVVAYLLGAGGGSAQASPTAPSTASTDGKPRTLVTTGTGTTVGVPDELTFSLSVGLVRSDLHTALTDTNATMARALTRLDQLGVRRSDVQTTGLQMNAVYDYHAYGPPTLRGYRVSQHAEVLVRDLARGGRAVTAAVDTGGNDVRVGDIGLRIPDTDSLCAHGRRIAVPVSLLAQTRQQAVTGATAKPAESAEPTGQPPGSFRSLTDVPPSS